MSRNALLISATGIIIMLEKKARILTNILSRTAQKIPIFSEKSVIDTYL